MATLRLPGLGPIVGHATSTTSRIWVRASPDMDDGDHPGSTVRTIAVIGVTRHDAKTPDPMRTFYFRLRREFDRSGSINLGVDTIDLGADMPDFRLEPDTEYVVRTGFLVLDDPIHDDSEYLSEELLKRLPPSAAWREDLEALDPRMSCARFRTFPEENASPGKLSFLLGSCRYPGLLWKVRHSDRIFGPMADLADAAEERPRFVLMVGDQIYADKFNRRLPLGRADNYQEFRDRYLAAFGSPNIRRLMQRLPTYMILDDHEIEDNWSQDRLRRSARYQLFTIAIDAYLSYQWSHGPRTWGTRLYYRFDCGGYPFFVLDTRTQRFYEASRGDLSDNHLLGRPSHPTAPPGQLQRLLNWLEEQQESRGNVPKFIVTSGVFVPSPMSARTPLRERNPEALANSDTWAGFPETRGRHPAQDRRGRYPECGLPVGRHPLLQRRRDVHHGHSGSRAGSGVLGHIVRLLLALPVRGRRAVGLRARLARSRSGGHVLLRGHGGPPAQDGLPGPELLPGRQLHACHRRSRDPHPARARVRQTG